MSLINTRQGFDFTEADTHHHQGQQAKLREQLNLGPLLHQLRPQGNLFSRTGAFVDIAYINNLGVVTANGLIANNNISAIQNITAGYAIIATSATINNNKITVNGSTSGTVIFGQPFNGSGYKKLVIYCNSLNGTASYTFPQPFLYTPAIVNTNGLSASVVTTLAANSITITGTGASTSGFIILEGFYINSKR